MTQSNQLSDDAVLAELGRRAGAARLARNLTQARLAKEAGVAKRTVERIEAGRSTQLTSFIRVLRALGLLTGLETLLPPPEPAPMDLLRRAGKTPQRARGNPEPVTQPWTWGDEA